MPALSPKQADSVARANGRINIWHGSVRSGKTVGSLWRWLQHVQQAPASGELIMAGKTLQTLHRNVIRPLQDPELFGPIAKAVQYTPGSPLGVILGRSVHMLGANDAKAEEKVRGMTGAGAYADEITLLPELFWSQLLSRMSITGAKVFGSTNPDNPMHWLRRDYILGGSEFVRNFQFQLEDNPFLDPEFVRQQRAMYHGLYYRRFILGQWVAAEGAVYDMWNPDLHVVDLMPRITVWICLAADYGTANPFHALLLGLGTDGCLYVAGEWRYDGRRSQRQMTDSEYADVLEGWLASEPVKGYGPITPQWWVVDPSAASFRTELKRRSLPQYPGDNSVLDGIRVVGSLLGKNRLRVNSTCKHLIEEISGYVWDDKAALLGEDRPLKENDHGVDALRYAVKTTQATWTPFVMAA